MAISFCAVQTDPQGKELTEHGTSLFPVSCQPSVTMIRTNELQFAGLAQAQQLIVTTASASISPLIEILLHLLYDAFSACFFRVDRAGIAKRAY